MTLRLIRNEVDWGLQAFSLELKGSDLRLLLKRGTPSQLRVQLAHLELAAIRRAPDLALRSPNPADDDLGVNRLVKFPDHEGVVFKRVRFDRVPTEYHEPYMAHVISSIGFKTLDYLGIAEEPDGRKWLLSLYHQGYMTLCDLIQNSVANPASATLRLRLKSAMFLVGVTARRLTSAGFQYSDLDFKNILIPKMDAPQLLLLDFERTRDINSSPQQIVRDMTTPLIRRLRRASLDQTLYDMLGRGFFFDPLYIEPSDLASWIQEVSKSLSRRPMTVALDGIAAAGKTHLSYTLLSHLPRACVVETDWFVIYDRAERSAPDFNARHDTWYDFDRLDDMVDSLQRGATPSRGPYYDHRTGRHSLYVDLDPASCEIILLEGMYAADPVLRRVPDLKIYLTCPVATAELRFQGRDQARARSCRRAATSRARQINSPSARRRLMASQQAAHLVLDTQQDARYRVAKVHQSLLPSLVATADMGRIVTSVETCPLCPTTPSAGRFDISGNCQAIYNIAPIVLGHVLVAPLRHVKSLHDLDDALRSEFLAYAYDITHLVLDRVGTREFDWALQDGVNAGQTVGHLHLHILPRKAHDLDRPGAWFTSLYGTNSGAPDSSERPTLDDTELKRQVDWLIDGSPIQSRR